MSDKLQPRTPTTLRAALDELRKERMHDYNLYTKDDTEGAVEERVIWLGIWDEEIAALLGWLPGAVVTKHREGMTGFWRVDVVLRWAP